MCVLRLKPSLSQMLIVSVIYIPIRAHICTVIPVNNQKLVPC